MPRSKRRPQLIEGRAALVERGEGSHRTPMVIERMFDCQRDPGVCFDVNYYFRYDSRDERRDESVSGKTGPSRVPKPTSPLPLGLAAAGDADRMTIVSATIPARLAQEVRARSGPRAFSAFVTRAIERELVRLSRLAFVADVEERTGPLDPDLVTEWRRRLTR
jgi:hypothetical protein